MSINFQEKKGLIGAYSDVSGNIENGIAPACRALISPVEMATGKKHIFVESRMR